VFELQSVETVASAENRYPCSPEERARAVVAAFTSPGKETSVLVGLGYSTFDHAGGTYTNVRCFGDMWECRLFENVRPLPNPKAAVAAGGRNITPSDLVDSTKIFRPSTAELTRFSPNRVFEALKV
jgi:hypothetical protein